MLREVLTLGDKIDIKQLDSNKRPIHGARTYVSQLIDFVETDIISIAAPIVFSKIVILLVGENYNICFYSNKGLYQCNCIVLSNRKENNTVVSVVRITSNLEKLQRRQYFRLVCIHDIEYRIVDLEEEILLRRLKANEFKDAKERTECQTKLEQFDKVWLPASVTDISGGGVKFCSSVLHKQGDKIKLKYDFVSNGELRKLVLGADIIESSRVMTHVGVNEHRVQFNNITQRDREALIKYIFEQERKLRKNDKI